MTIEPSLIVWTVLCFLALMLILKKLLFQPMLTFMDTRNAKIEAAQRLAENRAALAEESERITRELELQLSDLALDLVNHLQHWQDDRHSAVDAETIAAPYADIEHLTAGEHTNATTNRTK